MILRVMVEIRKIQQVGRSTLAVAIPKKWANEVNLKPGSQVSIEKELDGCFRIRTRTTENKRVTKSIINADECKAPDLLGRSITGIYLTGIEAIEIHSKKELTPQQLQETRDAVQRLTGLGIIEQTANEVIIHDFLDPAKFPFENLIKHMFQIISFMQETIIKTLEECDVDLASEVSNLEDEIDRLYWLTVRQLLLVVIDGAIGDKIGISSLSNAAGDYVIVKCLEDIADHYESISNTAADALKKGLKPDGENLREIIRYSKYLHTMTDNILQAILASDTFKANNLINEIECLLKDMDTYAKKLLEGEEKVAFVVNINSMLWNLREVARQNRSILETTINQCVASNQDLFNIEKTEVTKRSLLEV